MNKVTRDELIQDYQRLAKDLGKRPTLSEYNKHGDYSSTPIYRRFENFGEMKIAAGFEDGQQRLTDEELIEDLQEVADKVDRTPPVMVYDKYGSHNSKTLKARFGNWNQVLEKAGLDPTKHSKHWEENEPDQFSKSYGSVTVECSFCDGKIKRKPSELERNERFFCDYSCKGGFMSKQIGKEARSWEGGKVKVECEVCGGARFVVPAKEATSRFCSQKCMVKWRSQRFSGENHPRWKGGYGQYYGPNWRMQRRRSLERDGYECQVCLMERDEHLEKYNCNPDVHHKIRFGDFENYAVANKLENLITLCKRCHGLVEGGQIEI